MFIPEGAGCLQTERGGRAEPGAALHLPWAQTGEQSVTPGQTVPKAMPWSLCSPGHSQQGLDILLGMYRNCVVKKKVSKCCTAFHPTHRKCLSHSQRAGMLTAATTICPILGGTQCPHVPTGKLASPSSEVPAKPAPILGAAEKILSSATCCTRLGYSSETTAAQHSSEPEPSGNSPVHKLSSKPWLPCSHPSPNSHSVGGWEAP